VTIVQQRADEVPQRKRNPGGDCCTRSLASGDDADYKTSSARLTAINRMQPNGRW
jgi:hypothetical protein